MADRPRRIQLSRAKGWRMPDNTVKVSRVSRWENPFVVRPDAPVGSGIGRYYAVPTVQDAIACYREYLAFRCDDGVALVDGIGQLRGKNLACWCPLDQPCHADVLLELANGKAPDAAQ